MAPLSNRNGPANGWLLRQNVRVLILDVGIIAIVDKSQADDFQNSISESIFVIGELVNGSQKVILN